MLRLVTSALFPFAHNDLLDLNVIALILLLSVRMRKESLRFVHLILAHATAIHGLVRKWLRIVVSESPHNVAGVQSARNGMPAVLLAEESRHRRLLVVGTEIDCLRALLIFLRLSIEREDLSIAFFFRDEVPFRLLSARPVRHSHRSAQIVRRSFRRVERSVSQIHLG